MEAAGKLQASLADTRALQEQLAVVGAGRAYLTLGLVFYMVTHPNGSAFLAGLVLLGVAYGNYLLRLLEAFRAYAGQHIPQGIAYLNKQIRSGTRKWSSKSVPIAGTLNTAP